MARALLALGANVGNREENLRAALRWLAPQCRIAAVSSLYRSVAVVLEGAPPGPDYLNAACAVETELSAEELLRLAKDIEHALGRRPAARWTTRPIDIDIIMYEDERIDTADLVVPHPRALERNFVLVPLAEIAADAVHPVAGRSFGELAEDVDLDGLEHLRGPEWAAGALTQAGA